MLRDRVPVWDRNRGSGAFNIDGITKSGNYTMVVMTDDGTKDNNTPYAEDGFYGSNYWVEHRSLYLRDYISEYNQWFSQVAYSYYNPCIGVRCKTGKDSARPEPKWHDWEFTVMSGVHEASVNATLNGVSYKLRFKKHRNSDIVSLAIYLNDSIPVVSNYIKYGTRYKFITEYEIASKFRPTRDRIIPVSVCGLRTTGYGRADCVLVIQPNGEIWLYNEYGDTDSRDYSLITSGFECFYSIS